MKKTFTRSFAALVMGVAMISAIGTAEAGQSPQGVYPALNTSGYSAPLVLDKTSGVVVNDGGTSSQLAIAASAVVKASAGVVVRVSVTVAGSTTGSVYDANTLPSAGAANLVGVIPNTVGVYYFSFPMNNGIVVAPGTGQTVSVSYK